MTIELFEKVAPSIGYNSRKLAKLCGMSLRQLQRYFGRNFNRAPQDWLNERRILAAQRLLISGNPVKKVSADLGFKQVSHFCRQFKRFTRTTPSKFVGNQLDRL